MINENYTYNLNAINWPAIFAGIVIAIIIGLLFNLLGLGLGFAYFSPDLEAIKTLSFGALIWSIVSGVIAMFMGGWVSSSLSGVATRVKGYWQGFIVASLTVFLMACLATTIFSGIASGVLSSFSAIGNLNNKNIENNNSVHQSQGQLYSKHNLSHNIKALLPSNLQPLVDQISYEADILSESANDAISDKLPNSEDIKDNVNSTKEKVELYRKEVRPALYNFLRSINTENYDRAKNDLIDALSKASGKSREEIQAKVNEWQQTYENAKQKAKNLAKDVANKTAAAVSQFAFVNFFIILLSIIAGGIGGFAGATRVNNRIV